MEYDGSGTPVKDDDEELPRPRLLGEVSARLRVKHYSLRTEEAYLYWIRRYIRPTKGKQPRLLDGVVVDGFSRIAGAR